MLRFASLFLFLAWALLLQTAHATTPDDGDGGYVLQVDTIMEEEEERWAEFKTWAESHERKYESQIEEAKRFTIWMENDDKIRSHNSQIPPPSWTMGHNNFSDLTHKEFAAAVGLIEFPVDAGSHHHRALEEQIIHANVTEEDHRGLRRKLLKAVDWRSQVIVKSQGGCGSCWAFATTGAVEAFYKIKKSKIVNLAEQQLVDCSRANYGCNGGWPEKAISWVAASGLSTQSQYPYTGRDGSCKKATGTHTVTGPKKIPGSSSALQTALSNYPVTVCVDASKWSFYKSGVFSGCSSSQLNHAVLAVGYDASGNWFIKNSWGTGWGEKGFITLKAGNTCGVLNAAVMVI